MHLLLKSYLILQVLNVLKEQTTCHVLLHVELLAGGQSLIKYVTWKNVDLDVIVRRPSFYTEELAFLQILAREGRRGIVEVNEESPSSVVIITYESNILYLDFLKLTRIPPFTILYPSVVKKDNLICSIISQWDLPDERILC